MQNLLKCHVLNWRTRRKLKNNSIDKLQHGCELRSYEYHMFLKANLQKIGKILFAIFSIINSFKRFVTVAQVVVSISLRIKICVITDDELLSKIMCRCVSEFFFLWKGIDCKVVEDAYRAFFSTDRLPLLLPACVGSRLNFETEERGTTEVVENRSQLRIFQEREAVRRLSGGLNGFGE